MKKLLTVLFVFIGLFASAQKLDSIRGHGYHMKRGRFDSTAMIPTFCGVPTLRYKGKEIGAIAIDSCNNKFYFYNPKDSIWTDITSGSTVDTAGRFVNSVTFPTDSTAIVCKGGTCTQFSIKGGAGSSGGSQTDTTGKFVNSVVSNTDSTIIVCKAGTCIEYVIGSTIYVVNPLRYVDSSDGKRYLTIDTTGLGGGGGSQDLASVLGFGNTANNFVQIDSLKLYDSPSDGYGSISVNDYTWRFRDASGNEALQLDNQTALISLYKANGISWVISDQNDSLTANRQYQVPNKSGTIALLSDITGSTSDTIFVDAPLEAYTSGDSNKIRINPDTLAAWRPKYRVYTARISQTGTDAPTEDYVYENTLGSVSWDYSLTGKYSLKSLSPAFDANKTTTIQTVSIPTDAVGTIYYVHGNYVGDTEYEIQVGDGAGNLVDGKLTSYTIEIRVYY